MPDALDLLVIGSGYAGVWAALSAARQRTVLGASLRIGLVSREPYLTARPRLYEHGLKPDDARIAIRAGLAAVEVDYLHGEVVDLQRDGVQLADGRTLRARAYVLATGSTIARPPIPGLDQHGADADSAAAAETLWRRAEALPSNGAVVVLGGGFTGIELACEIAGWRRTAKPELRVLLVDRAQIAAGYAHESCRAILKALADLDVTMLEDTAVTRVDSAQLHLDKGTSLPCDLPIWAGGLQPSALSAVLARVTGAARRADGRIEVRTTLQIDSAEHWFAAGDVAAARVEDGHVSTFSCQHALSLGTCAGHNAVNWRCGEPLRDYTPNPYVTCLDLGPNNALLSKGFARELVTAGSAAKPTKQYINSRLIVPPIAAGKAALFAAADPQPTAERVGRTRAEG